MLLDLLQRRLGRLALIARRREKLTVPWYGCVESRKCRFSRRHDCARVKGTPVCAESRWETVHGACEMGMLLLTETLLGLRTIRLA